LLILNQKLSSYCKAPLDHNVNYNTAERNLVEMNFGYTIFDNFYMSMLTVFFYIRANAWSPIIFIVKFSLLFFYIFKIKKKLLKQKFTFL
jgi:hypothetical protein